MRGPAVFAVCAVLIAACAQPQPLPPPSPVRLQLLAINDFHGQLASRKWDGREVGGAAVLKAYLDRERARFGGETFILEAGDLVGASAPESALLQDEPAIRFLDLLANGYCGRDRDPRCDVIATLGNHELDEGEDELLRLIRGGRSPKGAFLDDPFRGSLADTICANAVDTRTGRTLLPPYAVRRVGGVDVGFVAATTIHTAELVRPEMISHTRFLDEAASINAAVAALRGRGVRAFVVLLHEGGEQAPYDGPTRRGAGAVDGRLVSIVRALDGDVDVVVTGHAHEFVNALLPNAAGRDVLVTQAWSNGRGYADIELEIDPRSRDVIRKTASIEKTWADAVTPDAEAAALASRAAALVGPKLRRVVGTLTGPASRERSEAGESALGDLVADAQRLAVSADVAFMNPGGLRADLDAGPVTWAALFDVHPFGNAIVSVTLTGAQIEEALEQQWRVSRPRVLQISGMRYAWSEAAPVGARAREIEIGGRPLEPGRRYTVAVNEYLASGGDGFTVFAAGADRREGPVDLDALEALFAASPGGLAPPAPGRIRKE
jgi:5'-nucleotidase